MSRLSQLEQELSVERERVAKLEAALRDIRNCAATLMPQHSNRVDLQAKIIQMNQAVWTRLAAVMWGAEDAPNDLHPWMIPQTDTTLAEWVDQNVDRNNTHQIAVYTALRNFAIQLDRLGVGK